MFCTRCNEKNCNGWALAIGVGAILYAITLVNFLSEVL
jgi:hypothetical protein